MKKHITFIALSFFYYTGLLAYAVTLENQCGMPLEVTLEYDGGEITTKMGIWQEVFQLPGKLKKIKTNGQSIEIASKNDVYFIITYNGVFYNLEPRIDRQARA